MRKVPVDENSYLEEMLSWILLKAREGERKAISTLGLLQVGVSTTVLVCSINVEKGQER